MKRIFLALALAAFAFTANAQFIISANISGGKFSGDTNIHTQVSVATSSENDTVIYPPTTVNYSAGLKLGYKFGKAQAGISGSYSSYSFQNQPLDPTIIPMLSSQFPERWASNGTMNSHYASYTVAPYFRYDVNGEVCVVGYKIGEFAVNGPALMRFAWPNIEVGKRFALKVVHKRTNGVADISDPCFFETVGPSPT